MKKRIIYSAIIVGVILSGAFIVNSLVLNDDSQTEKPYSNTTDNLMENENQTRQNQTRQNQTQQNQTQQNTEQENFTLGDIEEDEYPGVSLSEEEATISPSILVEAHNETLKNLKSYRMALDSSANIIRETETQGDAYLEIEVQDDAYFEIRRISNGINTEAYIDGQYYYERRGNVFDGINYTVSLDGNNRQDYPASLVQKVISNSNITGYELDRSRIVIRMDVPDTEENREILGTSNIHESELSFRVNSNGLIESFNLQYIETFNGNDISRYEEYQIEDRNNTKVEEPSWIGESVAQDPVVAYTENDKIVIDDVSGYKISQNTTISVNLNDGTRRSINIISPVNEADRFFVTDLTNPLGMTQNENTTGRVDTSRVSQVIITAADGEEYVENIGASGSSDIPVQPPEENDEDDSEDSTGENDYTGPDYN